MPKPIEKKLPKHHYIPVFYLKQWKGGDGRLCEFSRPYKVVVPQRKSPDGTGYVRGLYRLPNVTDDKAEIIENIYMRDVDNGAALALQVLLNPNGGPDALTVAMKIDWARFLHCLILRSPEYLSAIGRILKDDAIGTIESYRDDYAKLRKPHEPETFDEFKVKFLANPLNVSAARIVPQLANSELIVRHMCSMRWQVFNYRKSQNLLLTSDRPVIMTNGVSVPGAHIAIPISPHQIFIAFNDERAYREIHALSPKNLIQNCNNKIVEQAVSYVYGFSDAALSFVSGRLGRRVPSTPLETGVLRLSPSS